VSIRGQHLFETQHLLEHWPQASWQLHVTIISCLFTAVCRGPKDR